MRQCYKDLGPSIGYVYTMLMAISADKWCFCDGVNVVDQTQCLHIYVYNYALKCLTKNNMASVIGTCFHMTPLNSAQIPLNCSPIKSIIFLYYFNILR